MEFEDWRLLMDAAEAKVSAAREIFQKLKDEAREAGIVLSRAMDERRALIAKEPVDNVLR